MREPGRRSAQGCRLCSTMLIPHCAPLRLTPTCFAALAAAEPDPTCDSRYRMLETIQRIALDELVEGGESPVTPSSGCRAHRRRASSRPVAERTCSGSGLLEVRAAR